MSIDTKIIAQLRSQTGAGMVDCKNALEEAGGDLEKAIEILRKKGEIKAEKKSDRATSEGLIALAKEGDKVAYVSLNCETDFVARNEDFIKATNDFSKKLLASENIEEFKTWAEENIKKELVVKIGENMQLGDFGVLEGKVIGSYVHSNKKVAGLVVLSGGSQELADDIAMQITAMSPKYIKPEDISAEVLEKEKEIYREQLKKEGKPDEIIEKILEGKLAKFYEEVCLLKQSFIKDEDVTIEELIKKEGEDIEVVEFRRIEI